jgi:hypothetical protein
VQSNTSFAARNRPTLKLAGLCIFDSLVSSILLFFSIAGSFAFGSHLNGVSLGLWRCSSRDLNLIRVKDVRVDVSSQGVRFGLMLSCCYLDASSRLFTAWKDVRLTVELDLIEKKDVRIKTLLFLRCETCSCEGIPVDALLKLPYSRWKL